MSSWIDISSSRSEKNKDLRFWSENQLGFREYLKLTIREKLEILIGESLLASISPFRINVFSTAKSSVENENREKPSWTVRSNQQQITAWLVPLLRNRRAGTWESLARNQCCEWVKCSMKRCYCFRCLRWRQVNHVSIHVWIASGTASSCSNVQLSCIRCRHALPNRWESQNLSGNRWDRVQQSLCNPLPPACQPLLSQFTGRGKKRSCLREWASETVLRER